MYTLKTHVPGAFPCSEQLEVAPLQTVRGGGGGKDNTFLLPHFLSTRDSSKAHFLLRHSSFLITLVKTPRFLVKHINISSLMNINVRMNYEY